MTEPTGCDDGALMQITDDQIDWIVEKAAISRDAGRLALLSTLMHVRDLASVPSGQGAEGAALVAAVQHLKEALERMDTCDKGYDELLASHKWTDAELAETGATCEFFRGDVVESARAVVARLAGGPQ